MKLRFLDFEVTPEWWECSFGDYNPKIMLSHGTEQMVKDEFVTISSDMPDARDRIKEMFFESDTCMVGYNIKGYDLIIANAIYQGFTPEQVWIVNNLIIHPGVYETKEYARMEPFSNKRLRNCVYQDLMDDSDGSLKEKECVLGLNVLESSVPFDKVGLTDEDKDDMIVYNRHDVYATMYYYQNVSVHYVETKLLVGKYFNIPEATCYMCTNAKLVCIALGAKRKEFADAEKIDIELPSKIRDYCYANFDNDVLKRICGSIEPFEVTLFNNTVSFGNGGIHSTYDLPLGKKEQGVLYVESDEEYCLVNVDATSYYPSIMIQLGLLSRCIENRERFVYVFDKRVEIKHLEKPTKEDKELAAALKLILNTTFGASGNKYLDIYDPYMCSSVCRVGQIFLGALATKMSKIPDTKIIQTNTDGILLYTKRSNLSIVKSYMDEWTRVSGINMELDDVEKIWQRDVNNYLMVEDGGKVKCKGAWLNTEWTSIGYNKVKPVKTPVCAQSVKDYLLKGVDIKSSIERCTDLTKFVTCCKKGPSYRAVVQRMADGTEVELFKANRVLATLDESVGKLYKVKMFRGNLRYDSVASLPDHCKLLNEDMSTYQFEDIKHEIDYVWYIDTAKALLNTYVFKQLIGSELYATSRFNYGLD